MKIGRANVPLGEDKNMGKCQHIPIGMPVFEENF
jgi:hypothetical protein